jgi:hypothetical protein
MVASLRVKFGEGVVKEEDGWFAAICGEQFNLGKQERKEEAALLAARGDRGEIFFVNVEGEVVAVRADKRVPLVALTLGRLVKGGAQASGGGANLFVDAVPFTGDVVYA